MSVFVDTLFLSRTFRIRYGSNVGTGVYVEIEGICMVLTAAHIVAGIRAGDAIGIRNKDDWFLVEIDAYAECKLGSDVCAIRLSTSLGAGLAHEQLDGGLLLGEEVVYCGFPLGMEMRDLPNTNGYPVPLVKQGMLSGAISKGAFHEFLFDALNNSGFSGGPIVKRDRTSGKLCVAAIVSGYKFDSPIPVSQKTPGGNLVETADYLVRPNSGFMTGVPIALAVNAARTLI